MAQEHEKLQNVIDSRLIIYELITERHKAERKNKGDVWAIGEAIEAIVEQEGDTVEARILQYHYKEPEALLFRDSNTLRALRAGLSALQRKEEELRKCLTGLQSADACRP